MKKNKMTYAQVADKLTKKIGELEKKAKSSDRFARATAEEMLPRYKSKLDALYNAQEQMKVDKGIQSPTPQYNLGGDIAAGMVGLAGGALGTIPVVGNMAQAGLYSIHDKLDNNLTDQEKSIRGYGAAAGGIGASLATGNPMGAMGALGDIQEGYMYGQSPNPMGYAYGGRLPKYADGGEPPTYWEWIATRPDMQNDLGSKEVYNTWLTDVYPNTGFDPNKIYQGNIGAGEYDKSGTVQSPFGSLPPTEGGAGIAGALEGIQPGAGSPNSSSMGNMNWQDMLYRGAAYAPTAYNFARGLQKPQSLEAEDFQNPYESQAMKLMAGRRYNVDPQLQANRSTFNQMRGNLKNVSGGNAATYLSNMGQLQVNTDRMNEQAYAMKQNMDNQYRAEDAQMRANLGNVRAQRELQIQDINDRNKAARDAHMGKAFEGLSGIAQNEKMMSNLSARDSERMAALQALFPDYGYSLDDKGYVTGFNYKG